MLLETWRPPPTELRRGKVMLVRSEFPTIERDPALLAKLPTVVKLGVEMDVKNDSSKKRDPFTVAKD